MKERTQTLDEERFDLVWVDKGREPQCAPNPDFPDGVDVDVTMGQSCDLGWDTAPDLPIAAGL